MTINNCVFIAFKQLYGVSRIIKIFQLKIEKKLFANISIAVQNLNINTNRISQYNEVYTLFIHFSQTLYEISKISEI